MVMVVDKELCIGCGICVDKCPNDAIQIKKNIAVIDHANCTSCQECAEFCPTGALGLSEEIAHVHMEPTPVEKTIQPQLPGFPHQKQPSVIGALVSLIGQYVLPRIVDNLMLMVGNALASPTQIQSSSFSEPVFGRANRRHRQRRGHAK